jgi:hypothetical protein
MKTVTIYGCSDDLIETQGIAGCEEFAVYSESPYHGSLKISDGKETLWIHAIYWGCWGFAITNDDDESDYETMPDWSIRRAWGDEVSYSETVRIDVPDSAVLEFLKLGDHFR